MLTCVATTLLCSCASQLTSEHYKCSTGRTISQEEAIQIALRAKKIKRPSAYDLSVDKDEIVYYVSFKAKDESMVPSFGTVAVDYCGKVVTSTAPL